MISEEQARSFALTFLGGIDFGNWKPVGWTISMAAANAFKEMAFSETVQPIPKGRLSPTGINLDLYVPSAWHALCATLVQVLPTYTCNSTYNDAIKNADNLLGKRFFFRGQPRAWDIMPSGWRSPEAAKKVSPLLNKFANEIRRCLKAAPDPVAAMVGRPMDNKDSFAGLAQHYELPTNLVDLTLDPWTALGFACWATDAPPVMPHSLPDPELSNCGVIYIIPAHKLAAVGTTLFEFPPSYSKRLYTQKGLFVNFGPYPGEEETSKIATFSPQWSWVQQNCQRIFFPRTYPKMQGIEEFTDNELMEGDDLLKEIAGKLKEGVYSESLNYKAGVPWCTDYSNMEKMGLAFGEYCMRIDAYLRRVCLRKFHDCDEFDPIMFDWLLQWIEPEINLLLTMADMGDHAGLRWTAERIRKAKGTVTRIIKK